MIGFGGFSMMFTMVFVLVIGVFAVSIVKGIAQWNKNNHSPELLVAATVVTKRTNISHDDHFHDDHMDHSTSTTYYVTFEVASGDRLEFRVSGEEYGMLVEGDHGELTFQGTRYLGFVRR